MTANFRNFIKLHGPQSLKPYNLNPQHPKTLVTAFGAFTIMVEKACKI